MNILNKYFKGLRFTFIEEKKGYAVYGASIYSLLGGNNGQFILAFVKMHLAVNNDVELSELIWTNLQMRLLPKDSYKLSPQDWRAPADVEIPITLNIKERNRIIRFII